MIKLEIFLDNFKLAFDRDIDYHDAYVQFAYLDKLTGEIIWVYENDDEASFELGISESDNNSCRENIEKYKNKFIEIPP
jgi:hypothetical protein